MVEELFNEMKDHTFSKNFINLCSKMASQPDGELRNVKQTMQKYIYHDVKNKKIADYATLKSSVKKVDEKMSILIAEFEDIGEHSNTRQKCVDSIIEILKENINDESMKTDMLSFVVK